jgi:hypothetical protein
MNKRLVEKTEFGYGIRMDPKQKVLDPQKSSKTYLDRKWRARRDHPATWFLQCSPRSRANKPVNSYRVHCCQPSRTEHIEVKITFSYLMTGKRVQASKTPPIKYVNKRIVAGSYVDVPNYN